MAHDRTEVKSKIAFIPLIVCMLGLVLACGAPAGKPVVDNAGSGASAGQTLPGGMKQKQQSQQEAQAKTGGRVADTLSLAGKADSAQAGSRSPLSVPDSAAAAEQHLDSSFVDGMDTLSSANRDSVLMALDTLRTVVVNGDTVVLNRAGRKPGRDTLQIDSSRQSKSALDDIVEYEAKDSITFNYSKKRASLFGSSTVHYTNLELTADLITMSMDSSIVHALGTRDSLGNIETPPTFKQGDDTYEPDEIAYNFKTRKAFISNVYTQQGEGFLISQESKRDSVGTMYVKKAWYTTCDAKHPHFYIAMTKAKIRPGKDMVSGPFYLVVEDVPLPLALPYAFFPFSESYSSGIIMPTYGDETTRGFYLRDGGYYFAINDKMDLKVLGEIFTKGSWGISTLLNYKKRYHYSGTVNFSYQNTKEGDKNMPDYTVAKSFKLQWSHRQDAKANPSQSFSASVNFATSSYENNNLNSMYNPQSRTQSTRTSSVSFSKSFADIGLTLSSTMNLSQNMRDSSISVMFPSLNISLARFNPFKRKKMAGAERWYEKIAVSYTGTFSNSITTKEDKLLNSNLIRDWKNGMKHDVPVNASFTVLNYFNVTPAFNFTDRMYSTKVTRSWDTENQTELRDTTYGFHNIYDFNMSVSANTKLYGFYRPLFGHKISMIRHVFTPSVSFSYAPDFGAEHWGYWGSYVKTDANGNVSTVSYSPYNGALYGVPSQGKTGSVSFDISNNIEMKLNSEKDTTGYKKISLIDELGASMSYNMAAKEKPWSNLNTRLRLKLTKSYTFSMNAVFATYAYEFDENGNVRVGNHTEYSQGRFGRFQGMSNNFSYTLNNEKLRQLFGGGKDKDRKRHNDADEDDLDEYEEDEDINESNMDPELTKGQRAAKASKSNLDDDGYLAFQLPWSISFSYGVSMSENTQARINPKRMRYPYKLTHTLNFSGNIRLSDGWNITWSSGYDFNMHKLSMTTASLTRDLHCFSMSCSMVISPYTSFNFTFAAKASTLADALRWKKQSGRTNSINWYN